MDAAPLWRNNLRMARTVLIVDDHAGFRRSARRLLEAIGFEVVAEASDAAGAITTAGDLAPDLVLLDVHLPDGNGFDVAERLTRIAPRALVILTSSRDASDYPARLRLVGAAGFISKADLSAKAIEALVGAA